MLKSLITLKLLNQDLFLLKNGGIIDLLRVRPLQECGGTVLLSPGVGIMGQHMELGKYLTLRLIAIQMKGRTFRYSLRSTSGVKLSQT